VAKKLVTEHGGEIRAESAGLGRGSRFIVTLPSSQAPVDAPSPLEPSAHLAPVRRRVLVVDDNTDSAEMIQELLSQLGHETRIAMDGPEALRVASAFRPDIAFLDIGLPGMNGFELARRLRQLTPCATIPIIAVSGYARAVDRREALSAGFTDHFAKPIDLARLQSLVERAPGAMTHAG
jgi:CheY-like chemotaxis protein